MNRVAKYIVTLNLPRQVPELITYGRTVVTAMSPPNPWFSGTNPPLWPPLATVGTHLDDLLSAESLAQLRTMGAVAVRDDKRIVVEKDLRHLRGGAQIVVDANPGQEEVIARSAGLGIKKRRGPPPRVFAALHGTFGGMIDLEAPYAGPRASHYWQMSVDDKSWTSLPETVKGSTSVVGLVPGTIYYFRHRTLTAKGLSDWDQIVSIMAH